MRRDIEHVLRAKLQATLDGPLLVGIGAERRERPTGVATQSLHRGVEREKVTSDDGGVGSTRTHLPKRAAAIRVRCADSILAS